MKHTYIMPYSIEIKEGFQTSDDVLFTPSSIDKPFSFTDKDVITCNDAFFINATDVEIHLLSFLKIIMMLILFITKNTELMEWLKFQKDLKNIA